MGPRMGRPAQRIGCFERPMAFDLSGIKYPPACRIEGIATVHRRAIVPYHHIAEVPPVLIPELRLGGMRPQFTEQCFGCVQREPVDVCSMPSAEEEQVAPRLRMRGYDRMARTGCRSNIVIQRSTGA